MTPCPSPVHRILKYITQCYFIPHQIFLILHFCYYYIFAVSDAECHNLGPETIRAGRNLDAAINSLVSNFHHENDYFKVRK